MAQQLIPNSVVNNAAENGDNAYPISDDDLEYDDCEDYMDDSLPDRPDMANATHPGMGRGPYERAWTTDATRALIHIRGPLEGRFTEGRQKRTALWLQCTRQLQRMGYRYSAAKVQKKWHNILITYNKNLNKKYLSGYVHWEFFEEMFKYLEGKKANFDGQQQQQQQQQGQTQIQEQTNQEIDNQQQQQQQFQQQQLQTQQQYQQLPKLTVKSYPSLKQAPLQNEQTIQVGHYVDPQSLLQPQVQLETKSNDDFDEDSGSISELRQPKIEYDEENDAIGDSMEGQSLPVDITHGNNFENILNSSKRETVNGFPTDFHNFNESKSASDTAWWRDYFERKLQVEREKITMQRGMHRDLMQYHKTCLVQQEKIERIKIDAINNLTGALQKLVEAKSRKN